MVLVLFLFGTAVLIIVLFILIVLSSLKIEIKKVKANICLNQKPYYDYDIKIGLYLFNIVPILNIRVNPQKIGKLKVIEKIKKYRKKHIFNIDLKTAKIIIKTISPKLERLRLDLKISTENAVYTSFITAFTSSVISIILPYISNYHQHERIKYEVRPLYNEKNQIVIDLSSIICIKMVHIISIIYIVLIKRSGNKNGRTSNRRAYAHSYE